ncbi:hypothetical protein [uncultured Roseobacter sp.]|uniref:hypothetical protein n=1 Tax=uncultured Roseobacter sp. TaxID=114847 RepID=UPI002614AF11|nr:hypothetical protein [uncultured Roseobacter sp.]
MIVQPVAETRAGAAQDGQRRGVFADLARRWSLWPGRVSRLGAVAFSQEPVVQKTSEIGFRASQEHDVDVVLGNLAARTLREMDRYLRHHPPGARIGFLREHVSASIVAARSDTFLLGDAPVGIVTHTPERDYHYTTALPTERCFQRDFLRISRRYNRDLAARLGTALRAYSRSDHAKVAAWFALMGFRFAGWDGDARVFIYDAVGAA